MTQREGRVWVGTGGWNYDHWSGLFYPQHLKQQQWLGFYAQKFNTVEITHTSLIMVPSVLDQWIAQVGTEFRFSIKVPLKISQVSGVTDPHGLIQRLAHQLQPLDGLHGPVLLQIPAALHKDLGMLRNFLDSMPLIQPLVLEFRHPSWYEPDVIDLLDQACVGFCIHDIPHAETPRVVTGGMIYMRFHGAARHEDWSYNRQQLRRSADWIRAHSRHARRVYAYFNNDTQAHAVYNAKQFRLQLALNRIPIVSIPPMRSSGHSATVHQ